MTICPLTRFTQGTCCDKPSHATNAGSEQYKTAIKQNLATVGRNIREILSANNIRKHRSLNTTTTILDVPDEVAWESDGALLTDSAYTATLQAIISESATLLYKRALPTPGHPPAKRLHSDPGASSDTRRHTRRLKSDPTPSRHSDRSEQSPERCVRIRNKGGVYQYRY